jgi:hypothetical protein
MTPLKPTQILAQEQAVKEIEERLVELERRRLCLAREMGLDPDRKLIGREMKAKRELT